MAATDQQDLPLILSEPVPGGKKLRTHHAKGLSKAQDAFQFGLSAAMVTSAVDFVYDTLDRIDRELLSAADLRLSQMLELANLSAIIGNLFRAGVCHNSDGFFAANRPHTYPDLVAKNAQCSDIEIKIALENNKPKGHLAKPGPHIIVRYVLCDENGKFTRGKENRGTVPCIWEVRVGSLAKRHFNISNTEGDSGKTAVINAEGMDALRIVYFDAARCPLAHIPTFV